MTIKPNKSYLKFYLTKKTKNKFITVKLKNRVRKIKGKAINKKLASYLEKK